MMALFFVACGLAFEKAAQIIKRKVKYDIKSDELMTKLWGYALFVFLRSLSALNFLIAVVIILGKFFGFIK